MNIRLLLFLILFISCENALINDDPDNTQRNNFEIYWNDFDKNYAAFTARNINWDSVYQAGVAKINNGLSDPEFCEMMADISLHFRDIHVELITPQKKVLFDSSNPNSSNGLISISKYFNGINPAGSIIKYSTFKNTNIGYIQIPSFSSFVSESEFKKIDDVLANLRESDGIVIDIRNNQGGNLINQKTVAARFIDETFVYFRSEVRNGPDHNDFAPPFEDIISPDGDIQYLKPIVILTNRKTASAAEAFAMTLKNMSHVTIVGDTTAAGLGINIRRELPNGWSYRMTVGLISDGNGTIYEGIGIPPDETVFISKRDSTMRMDKQLLKGLKLLN